MKARTIFGRRDLRRLIDTRPLTTHTIPVSAQEGAFVTAADKAKPMKVQFAIR